MKSDGKMFRNGMNLVEDRWPVLKTYPSIHLDRQQKTTEMPG
jgi:hypothetical protein